MSDDVCPKCGFSRLPDAGECSRCGIIFARWNPQRQRPPVRQEMEVPEPIAPSLALPALSDAAQGALVTGAALGLLFFVVPLLKFFLSFLVTLIHEMGHAGTWWLLGYPAIPAFDFVYGGGVTMHQNRNSLLLLVVFIVLSLPFIRGWQRPRILIAWASVLGLYSLVAFTSLGDIAGLAMGHGAEILWVILCLFRLLSGWGLINELERPLYGLLGVFTWLHGLRFGWKLMFSSSFRAEYGAAKGGGNWMDFDRIAAEYLGTDVGVVACCYFLFMLTAPGIAWLLFRYQEHLLERFEALRDWLEA